MVIASYAASRRRMLLSLAALIPVGALVIGLADLRTTRGAVGEGFFAFAVGLAALYAYYFGFHKICLVELTPAELRWRQALRGGAAPLGDVQSIRWSKHSRRGASPVDVATVEFTSRRPLQIWAHGPGLTEFLAKVHDTAPQVTVEPLSWLRRMRGLAPRRHAELLH
jgi:hypothetical protein